MARRPDKEFSVSASDALEFEPEPKRRRGIPTTAWLLLVLVLVTGAGLGGFLFGDRLADMGGGEGGQVPVVHAAQGAIKVRPQNPGGQEIPFRDYDINKRMQGEEPTGRVENLLPPPEQAKALPQETAAPPAGTPPVPAAQTGADPAPPAEQANAESLLPAAPAPAPTPVAPQPLTPSSAAPAAVQPAPTPPPAKTVAVAPTPKPAPQPAPPPPAPQTQAPAGGPMQLVPKSQQTAPTPAQAPAAAPAQEAPKETAKAAPAPPAAPETIPASSWQIQLAASRAATAAKAEGERLKKKYSDVLGAMAVNIVRADLGAKGVFYRIRLGPAGDKTQARAVCANLSKRGQGCLVIAPGK
ncbi:MAG TPA: hypothetical protein DCG48_05650 [Rhodospirillaceae bacterium]|nr:hypothetical protein [Rhodospirillaceae bacterium]